MASIAITVRADDGSWRADNTGNARIVNGNSDYRLALTFEGDGWGFTMNHIRLVALTADGEQTETAIDTMDNNPPIAAMTNVSILRVYITRNDRTTETPAIIFCDACITDDSGLEDEPSPDIYHMMTEYIRQRRSGSQSAADALLDALTACRADAQPAFPGSAYRLTAQRCERVTTVDGTLTLAGGTEVALTADMIASESLGIVSEAVSGDALLPGGVPSAELSVTLRTEITPEQMYGAEISLTYRIQRHDEHWCSIPLGVFTVAAAEGQSENGVQVTAYDDMQSLERIQRSSLPFASGQAYTPEQIIQTIADKAGIEWDGVLPQTAYSELPSYIVSRVNGSIETARDLLSWTMQVLCSIAVIDRFRILRIRKIAKTEPVTECTPQELITARVSRLPYRLHRLNITATLSDTEGNTGESKVIRTTRTTFWADGVTADLPENPLWDAVAGRDSISGKTDAMGTVTEVITSTLDPVTYDPGEIVIYGDPALDLLDWADVRTLTETGSFPITRSDWHYRGQHTVTGCGVEAVAGVAKSQAEKAELAHREDASDDWEMTQRYMLLTIIQSVGHQAMAGETHEWLSHFTHAELGGKV